MNPDGEVEERRRRRRLRERRRYHRAKRQRLQRRNESSDSDESNSNHEDSANDPSHDSSSPSSLNSQHSEPEHGEYAMPYNQGGEAGGNEHHNQSAESNSNHENSSNDSSHDSPNSQHSEPEYRDNAMPYNQGAAIDVAGVAGDNEQGNQMHGHENGNGVNNAIVDIQNEEDFEQLNERSSGGESSDAASLGGSGESASDEDSDSDSNLSDSEEEQEDAFDNEPIYNGAGITVRESLLAILSFIMVHKLTGLCLHDLLSLIALHCGPNSPCLKSLYQFKNYFKMVGSKFVTRHFYCTGCEVLLRTKDSICEHCEGRNNVSFFIEFPIVTQLQIMFKRPGFFDSLSFRFNREKKNPENLEDIYDSNIYKEHTASGFLSNPNNISFFMYFDGVSLFKSSLFSIWPVYLTINELSYKLRTRKENTILAGIWFGKNKPNPNLFLQPLHEKLLSLKTNGVVLSLPDNRNVLVRCMLLGAVADMPAKSSFMRFKQFNGAYSCFNCTASGGRLDIGNNASIQVFPYSRDLELRDNADIEQFAEQAVMARQVDPKASVYGVKGHSLLSAMLPNLILCMGQDIMHGVYLNAQKTILSLWFDTKYSEFPFSISDCVDFVDLRLKNIKPPSTFQNLPRSIKKDLGHYKAFDFKMFMTYYSLVVLHGVLPDIYWFHHLKFVSAISMLSLESISLDQIEIAEHLLHEYVQDFQHLYGLRFLTLTFHQLLHLPQVVRNLGPTWVYSCFFYESLNGQLSRLVHGSRHAALQISSACSAYLNLPVLIDGMTEGRAKDLCLQFQGSTKCKLKIAENIDGNTDVVGKFTYCNPVPVLIRQLLQNQFNIIGGRCKYFHRLRIRSTVFCSELYNRSMLKCSCYVHIIHEGMPFLGKIASFIRWSSCINCPVACADCRRVYLVIVKLYERSPWEMYDAGHPTAHYIHRVNPTENSQAFPVNSIKSLCLYMNVDGKEYLCEPLNALEVE